jgi:hypothetical protein
MRLKTAVLVFAFATTFAFLGLTLRHTEVVAETSQATRHR